jgi:type IV pilus assembly protein PilE
MKNGFSLIELMFCLAMVVILATIAVPMYSSHLIAAKRLDGKTALLHFAAQLEQYYTLHLTYATATIAVQSETDVLNSDNSPQAYYQLAFVEKNTHSFLIEAIPVGQQANDKQCGHLRFNQLGEKTITGNGSLSQCWG